MTTKILKLVFLALFTIAIPAFAQKKIDADSLVISRYNKWLKTFQLDQLVTAAQFKTIRSWPANEDDSTKKANGTIAKVLVLKPAAKYSDAQDLATAWNYVSEGLKNKGINLQELMLTKLASYAELPLSRVKIIEHTDTLGVFSLNIYFDGKIRNNNKINVIMGGELTLDYDFDASPINSILSNSYSLKRPVAGLSKYLPIFNTYFKQYKHKSDANIDVRTMNSGNHILEFKIINVVGQITGNYNEIIKITITKDSDDKGVTKIGYSATVLYAGGVFRAPDNEGDYTDAANEPSLSAGLKRYNKLLDDTFRQIFHAGF